MTTLYLKSYHLPEGQGNWIAVKRSVIASLKLTHRLTKAFCRQHGGTVYIDKESADYDKLLKAVERDGLEILHKVKEFGPGRHPIDRYQPYTRTGAA